MTNLDRALKDALVLGLENDATAERVLQIAAPFVERAFQKQVDHIEKLKAALREMLLKCTWADTGRWCGSIDCHCRIARKALEVKDD
jgi:hypothetical protein